MAPEALPFQPLILPQTALSWIRNGYLTGYPFQLLFFAYPAIPRILSLDFVIFAIYIV